MNQSLFLKVISVLIVQFGIVLILSGCKASTIISQNTEAEIKPVITNYIQSEKFIKYFSSSSINGKTFCSYHFLGADKKNKNNINAYLWLLCDEYNSKLKRGSVTRVPIVTVLKKKENTYQVTNYQYPGNGSFYQRDLKKLFPGDIREQIFKVDSEQPNIINDLNQENYQKAQAYFKKN